MKNRNTHSDLSPEAIASEDASGAENGDALPAAPAALPPTDPEVILPPADPPQLAEQPVAPQATEVPPTAALAPYQPPDADPTPPLAPVATAALQQFPVASVLPPVAPLLHESPAPTPLEHRIQRLESELARLRSDRRDDPDAVPPPAPNRQVRAPFADPAAAVVRQPGHFWPDVSKRLLTPSGPVAAPPPAEGFASMVPPAVRRTWILMDALTELRAVYWMYFDPRYRLSWTARLAPWVIAALIVTSYYWMPATSIPVVGLVIDKVADLALTYILFKLLSHEARRYRETAPDLPPGLRQ